VGQLVSLSTRGSIPSRLGAVPSAVDTFVGRRAELEQLSAAFDAARAGRGSTWFACGAAGIGKSRFSEEAARVAAAHGSITLWGRCWEAGGAPAYWPWVQVLRSLLRGRDSATLRKTLGERRQSLAQLMPELADPTGGAGLQSDPQTARFALMDAVASTLCDVCADTPLFIVLEDLHAADPATITLLDFVSRQIDGSGAVILATYRPSEAQRSEIAEPLRRLAMGGHTLHLAPLSRDEIRGVLGGMLDHAPTPQVLDAWQHATDGNPLFLVEMCRWSLAKRGTIDDNVASSVPPTLRAAISERVATLPEATVRLLEAASVIGHEFRAALVAAVVDQPLAAVSDALAEAVDRDVLIETLPGQLRFSHILIREAIHGGLDEQRSEHLHRCVADALQQAGPERGPASQVAHHYFQAGPEARARAVTAAEHAAQRAAAQLAYDDAVDWYQRALTALRETDASEVTAASQRAAECRLLLGLGSSAISAGKSHVGKGACLEASRLARSMDDADLLAQAALTHGREFEFGMVDPELIGLLQEALDVLPQGPSSIRAQLLARLAAALQPATEPQQPIEMALAALEMARATANDEQLLLTLRSAGSALMDFALPEVRIGVNREHASLAERLGDRVEALRAETRLVFDYFEMGDPSSTAESIAACESKAEQLGYEHFRWRARGLSAMWAIWQGDFAKAAALQADARRLAEAAGDPNGPRCLVLQDFGIARLRGVGDLQRLRSELDRHTVESPMHRLLATVLPATLAVTLGREGAPWVDDVTGSCADILRYRDPWLLEMLASSCDLLDEPTVREAYSTLSHGRATFIHGGLAALTLCAPRDAALAKLAVALGDHTAAERHYRSALSQIEAADSPPLIAWTSYDLAKYLHERGGDRAEIRSLLEVAAEIAERCDMPGLTERVEQLRDRASAFRPSASAAPNTAQVPPSPAPNTALNSGRPAPHFELCRDGEVWSLSSGQQRWQLRDTKGLRWLSKLLAEPGREFHVLDLTCEGEAVDGGDNGAILDAQAKRQYAERIEALRAEETEAESFNDMERAHRARAELESLAQQLAAGLGMGGRERRSGSALEKARINVQRRLKDAVQRISRQDSALGRHLERSLQTGTYCSYQPE